MINISHPSARPVRCTIVAVVTAVVAVFSAGSYDVSRADVVAFFNSEHIVTVPLSFRYRPEYWKAFTPGSDSFHGLRARVGVNYRYKQGFRLLAEVQGTGVFGLSNPSTGAGAVDLGNNGGETDPASLRPNQLFAQFGPVPGTWVRLGRSYIDGGSVIRYDEGNWQYLKQKRLGQRLLGSVGFSNSARANDGIASRVAAGDHVLHLYAAQPTTGVFVVDDEAYRPNRDIQYAGLDWTAPRGTLLESGELSAFALGYSDHRDPAQVAGLFGDIEVFTFGGSWLHVRALGQGNLDLALWAALQFGDYVDAGPASGVRERDQRAGALVAEAGYQRPDLWGAPWFRFGVNWASGDADLDDDDRETFFNVLPTNHLYYGAADQLAFQNLLDVFLQLKLKTPDKLGIDLIWHRFRLDQAADFRWAGTGAFSRANLGYARSGSNDSDDDDVGHELDLTLSYPLPRGMSLSAAYSRFWGGDVFSGRENDNLDFAYVQFAWKH